MATAAVRFPCAAELLLLTAALGLLHCGPGEEEAQVPAAPADRESWGVRLEVVRPEIRALVTAGYVRELLAERVARADSGVTVAFTEPDGRSLVRASARRLTLESEGDWIALADGVSLAVGDSLEVVADTAICQAVDRRVWVPGPVRLIAPQGETQGVELRTGMGGERWSLQQVETTWREHADGRGYQATVTARAEQGQRQGGIQVQYDGPRVTQGELQVSAASGLYDQGSGLFRLTGGVTGVDSGRVLAADEVECWLREDRIAARGSVRISDAAAEPPVELSAEEVVRDRRRDRLVALGRPAVFRQGDRQIEAPRLQQDAGEGRLHAGGGVTFRQGERRVQAAELDYWQDRDSLVAVGRVSLVGPEVEGAVSAGRLVYDLRTERAVLSDRPRLEQGDSATAGLVVEARALTVDLRTRRLNGDGEFKARTGDLRMSSNRGEYDDQGEVLLLAGRVVVVQQRADSGAVSRIEADSVRVRLAGDRPDSIDFPVAVQGTVEPSAGRVSWLQGGGGQAFFRDGRLERIALAGGAQVVHRRLDREEVVRFRGRTMILHFAGDDLARAEVRGGAELESLTPGEQADAEAAANRVAGESMEVFFDQGILEKVEMGPVIEGSYYPPPEPAK
ncbi:MAG: LptA/OstA family protein [Candidatus Latescibacterota bacterium]|jgi:lipopolysaccharide export system protein LptA